MNEPNSNLSSPLVNSKSSSVGFSNFLNNVFAYMGTAVLISAITAYVIDRMGKAFIMAQPIPSIISLVLFIAVPFIVPHASLKSKALGLAILYGYAVITGAIFSSILLVYNGRDLASAFVSSSAVFIGMALIGKYSHKNMAHLGTQLFGAVIGLIVASFICMFFYNSLVMFAINVAGVIIFSLYTMYDTHLIKHEYANAVDSRDRNATSVMGALMLYLDFVNLFLDLLELIGGSKRN